MPAATCKTDLIAVTEQEFAKLTALIARIEDGPAMEKHDADTSIKDVIAHRAHWIGLFLGWHHDGAAGRPVFFPAEGYKWSDLAAYNARLRADQSSVTWADAKAALSAAHDRLTGFMHEMSNDQLYGGPMKGARNTWTTGRWAEAAGPSHYRSAAKWIRAVMRGRG